MLSRPRARALPCALGALTIWLALAAAARTAAADVTANPTTHDYGNQQIGVADTPLTVALNNGPGGIMVTVPATACGGAVSITPNGVRTIASTGTDVLSFVFTPIDRNALNNCVVTLDADSGTDPTITLNGDGVASDLNITAGSIAFNNQRHNGGTPETRTLTIQNTGEVAITAAQLSAVLSNTTDFSIGALSGTIPAGGSATLPVTFNPTTVGAKAGTLTITASNDFPDDTIVINLTGTGTQSVVTVPANLDFGQVPVATAGTATLRIDNTGNASANLASIAITGPNAARFRFTDNGCTGQTCTGLPSIPASGFVALLLACQHSASATFTATLTVTSDDGVSSTDVTTLACETIPGPPAVAVTPATGAFPGVQRVGTPASVRTITISNGNEAELLTYSASTSSATEFPLSCAGGGTGCLSGVLTANSSVDIQVGFVPSTTGGRSGSVTIATNDTTPAADAMKVVPVSGTGGMSTAAGAATLAFGDVNISTVGGSSLTYRLTNSGTVSLNLGTLAITGDTISFNFNQTGCAGTTTCAGLAAIAPSAFTDLTLRCDPSSIGAKTATLNIPSDDPLSPKTVMLTCNGTTPEQENLDLPVAAFPSTRVGTPSAPQTFRIRNNAGATTAPLVINSITSSSGDFLVTCTPAPCARTVPAGTLVTVNVLFQPTATGSRTGIIAVRTNDLLDGTTDVPVSGTGVEPTISLTTPAGGSLSFADTRVNTASAAQTITITNTGSMDLTINSVTNSNAADFILTGPTGVSIVGAGMTLSWMVQCEPNTQGTRNGTITIANNSANQTSLPVSLTCSAIRGSLTVTSSTPFAYNTVGNRIDFGATFLGQTKMTTVTIGNDGNRPVTLVTPTVTASQGFTLGAPSGMTVPAGGSITLVVTFLPTLVTHGTATVSIASDWNTLAFEVTGDGQDNGTIFALDPPCMNGISTFGFAAPVAFDATASQQFCFKNLGEAPAQITGVQLIDMSPGGPNFTVSGIPLVAPFPTLNRDQSRVFTITAVPNDTMLGTFTATLRITTTLPGADAVRDLTVTYTSSGPGLTVGPAMALAFGGVDVDAGPAMLPLTLQNTGTAPLPITNIAPGPTGRFSIVGTPPTSIAVGATETLMVSYDPTVERSSATTESSTFTINTGRYFLGGVAQPTAVMITMTGYGIDQHIEVRGDGGQPVVAFGDVYRSPRADDPRARKTIQVCNTGEALLRVTMTGGADAPFSITGGDDLTLAGTAPPPGAAAVCQDVTVEFRPSDATYQPYSDTAQVMNDDDGRAMVDVMLTGRSIARPVTVPSALVAPAGVQIAVGVPARLSEILADLPGLTAANVSTSSESFAISIADGTGYSVVGDNDRELTAGETEVYDLTITATQPGPVTVNVAVHLDGDPHPHATIPITVDAIDREPEHLYGCAAGRGARGGLALLALVFAVALRRRTRRQ